MFDKLKRAALSVTKSKSTKPLGWIDDLVMQARLSRKEGMTGTLTITLDEVEDLAKYRTVVLAAEEFWEFHRHDIDWMTDTHVTQFLSVMKELYEHNHSDSKRS